ncbi:MAG: hypothetical protein ATN35_12840 [Epulopiscium sp. Nele67-Bin004]|nr:MAG: hypothetical protein ATN35_12840 [Epulopiscium sp. Nele67-Bin004]
MNRLLKKLTIASAIALGLGLAGFSYGVGVIAVSGLESVGLGIFDAYRVVEKTLSLENIDLTSVDISSDYNIHFYDGLRIEIIEADDNPRVEYTTAGTGMLPDGFVVTASPNGNIEITSGIPSYFFIGDYSLDMKVYIPKQDMKKLNISNRWWNSQVIYHGANNIDDIYLSTSSDINLTGNYKQIYISSSFSNINDITINTKSGSDIRIYGGKNININTGETSTVEVEGSYQSKVNLTGYYDYINIYSGSESIVNISPTIDPYKIFVSGHKANLSYTLPENTQGFNLTSNSPVEYLANNNENTQEEHTTFIAVTTTPGKTIYEQISPEQAATFEGIDLGQTTIYEVNTSETTNMHDDFYNYNQLTNYSYKNQFTNIEIDVSDITLRIFEGDNYEKNSQGE